MDIKKLVNEHTIIVFDITKITGNSVEIEFICPSISFRKHTVTVELGQFFGLWTKTQPFMLNHEEPDLTEKEQEDKKIALDYHNMLDRKRMEELALENPLSCYKVVGWDLTRCDLHSHKFPSKYDIITTKEGDSLQVCSTCREWYDVVNHNTLSFDIQETQDVPMD